MEKIKLIIKLLFTKHFAIVFADKDNKNQELICYNDKYNNCLYYVAEYGKTFFPGQ